MKTSKIILLLTAFLSITILSFAQTTKNITLKDGSTVKGVVTNNSNGVYTVQTDNIGVIQIKDENIVSISSQSPAPQPQAPSTANTSIENQMNQVQGVILSDPELMQEIQALIKDPQIMETLKDQKFIDDVMTHDAQKIQQNQKTQELLNNPQMKQLMEKINQKVGTQPAQETPHQ